MLNYWEINYPILKLLGDQEVFRKTFAKVTVAQKGKLFI